MQLFKKFTVVALIPHSEVDMLTCPRDISSLAILVFLANAAYSLVFESFHKIYIHLAELSTYKSLVLSLPLNSEVV